MLTPPGAVVSYLAVQAESMPTRRRGRIIHWDDRKGFGFVLSERRQVFLHRKDFSGPHRRPSVGDVVAFTLGKDPKGRTCARNAELVRRGLLVLLGSLLTLLPLLLLPVVAVIMIPLDTRWLTAGLLVVNGVTFVAYARDRRFARLGVWRTPEIWLHFFELIGGWPAAWIAQRWLRHKCSKAAYQSVFWLIVIVHQAVSLDWIANWRASRWVAGEIQQSIHRADAPLKPNPPPRSREFRP